MSRHCRALALQAATVCGKRSFTVPEMGANITAQRKIYGTPKPTIRTSWILFSYFLNGTLTKIDIKYIKEGRAPFLNNWS